MNRTNLSKILLLFCLLGSCMVASAQESKQLSLQEAIDLSIKNSKQLKLGQAKITEAVAATKEASERRLPDVGVNGTYLRVNHPKLDIKTATAGNDSNAISPANINEAYLLMANVSMPIFAGFKVKYGVESAQFLEKAAQLDVDNDRQGVILNAIAAYVNLYKAGAAVKLVEENLQQSRQRDTDFVNLERNGTLARNDLLKAQQETSNLELTLLDAQNNHQLAMVNMDLMLGLPEKTQLIADSASFVPPATVKTIEEYEQLAATNRYDLKALDYRQKAAQSDVKIAKGDNYPSLAFTGGYVLADIPRFLVITNALNAGLGLKYSLSSLWKTNSKVAQAKARETQLAASMAMLDDAIRLSINQAYLNYLSGVKKIEVYNKALDQATENYRINKNKYANNLLTLTDLLDADVSQLQARLNVAFAKAELVLAYQTLLQKAGLINQ
ncbi:transporter [Niastella yeongjuensis]|uniref:Transporter n=1 Tax=Niastella yeongjuensis TaxID=354355 RepID=A0A1V9F2K7_9BACT|nr:TolC family protein [Niastella yeongjuensis]OQP52526.1 transporter [Niastella yeongjuensis]SEP34861.1 Outer membrane protein TolC [Niastella yeongjuensis]